MLLTGVSHQGGIRGKRSEAARCPAGPSAGELLLAQIQVTDVQYELRSLWTR